MLWSPIQPGNFIRLGNVVRCATALRKKRRHRASEEGQILGAGEAVVAILDQGDLHVAAFQLLGNAQGGGPGYVGVPLTLEQADRAPDRDGSAEERVPAAILDQGTGEAVGLFAIEAWTLDMALRFEDVALGRREAFP